MSSASLFHKFDVTSQVFFERRHTLAIVNLKPIVPLHVLVIPRKPHPRLADLPTEELNELFESVQTISNRVQELVQASACTVSIQDGADAGQSVPHLHVHILPRRAGDFTPNDIIYSHLEEFGLNLHKDFEEREKQSNSREEQNNKSIAMDASKDRQPRTEQAMQAEARWLKEKMAQ